MLSTKELKRRERKREKELEEEDKKLTKIDGKGSENITIPAKVKTRPVKQFKTSNFGSGGIEKTCVDVSNSGSISSCKSNSSRSNSNGRNISNSGDGGGGHGGHSGVKNKDKNKARKRTKNN